MNTSKQVNIMIGLLFLAFVGFAAYIATENNRIADAEEHQAELFAHRGADIFVHSCSNCHGPSGQGTDEGGIAPRLRRNAFLVLAEDNPWGGPETPIGEANEIHDFLFNTIACGRTNTPMPVWSERYGGSLSELQIEYLVTMMTDGRWDLVDELWHEYEEEQRELNPDFTVEDYLVSADELASISMTSANCGQYPGASANHIRQRDPFSSGAPAPTGTPDGEGTAGPGPGDGPAVVMQDIQFGQTELSLTAGEETELGIRNEGALAHDFTIDEIPAEYESSVGTTSPDYDVHVVLNPGEQGTLTMTVSEAGEYTFYCSVPGHREAGMEGTLTVQ